MEISQQALWLSFTLPSTVNQIPVMSHTEHLKPKNNTVTSDLRSLTINIFLHKCFWINLNKDAGYVYLLYVSGGPA